MDILNTFQDKEPRIASVAANNLCLINYLVIFLKNFICDYMVSR